jgi:hypothetical protein
MAYVAFDIHLDRKHDGSFESKWDSVARIMKANNSI